MTDNIRNQDNERVETTSSDDAARAQLGANGETKEPLPADQHASDTTDDTLPDDKNTAKRVRRPAAKNSTRSAKQLKGDVESDMHTGAEGIIELTLEQQITKPAQLKEQPIPDEEIFIELAAQGFTVDEAARLLHVSDRIAHSRERQDEEAVIRRLRFNRWLFEQGKLNEFSA